MRLFQVVEGPAPVGVGEVVALTPAQYAPREHALRSLGQIGDRQHAEVVAPIEFKAGEVVALECDPPKGLAPRWRALEPDEPVDGAEAPARRPGRRRAVK